MSRAVTRGRSAVHKFDVAIRDEATVLPLSPSARIVHVDQQSASPRDMLQVWALVAIDGQGNRPFSGDGRRFYVHGTGHPIPGGREHCGTVLTGGLVWHVFTDAPA